MKLQEIVNEHNREPTRVDCRMKLHRWGRVHETCRMREQEMDEFSRRIEATAGLISVSGGNHVDGGKTPDPTAGAVQTLCDLKTDYERIVGNCADDIKRELKFKEIIDQAVEQLSPTAKQILYLRYGQHAGQTQYSWTAIGLRMHMSEDGVRKIERRAIDKINSIIRSETKV